MKSFSSLNIKLNKRFAGDRVKIEKIEGDTIEIIDFEIRESKITKENDPTWDGSRKECLYLQIRHNGKERIMWGSYRFLIDQIKQVDRSELPITATIVNEHGYILK